MGELFALGCAIVWATAVIFIKRAGETYSPFALNLFRVGVSSVLLIVTTLLAGQGLYRADVPLHVYLTLIASGVIAVGVADTMFHKGLNIIGAGITAIIDCLYSPLVVAFAFILLGERLSALHGLGMALILGGVLLASRIKPPGGHDRNTQVKGVLWAVGSMFALSFGVVIAKTVLDDVPVLWATTVRQVGAMAFMIVAALISPRRRAYLDTFRPRREWRFALPATILGSYFSLMLWLGGMKYTDASIAAILNQTSTIFVLIFASIFLHEAFTRRKFAAAFLAICGILLVTLS